MSQPPNTQPSMIQNPMLQNDERLRRWRLLLGGTDNSLLNEQDRRIDAALAALYNSDDNTDKSASLSAGLGRSAPRVARWLGDIREYFPSSVVKIMQQDAIERLDLQQLLLEPEMLVAVEADVHMVATIIALGRVIPERSKDSARQLVRRLVEQLLEQLRDPLEQAVRGSLNRARRSHRPRPADIDWARTIKANLKHYQPEHRTIIPAQLIGFSRQRKQALQDVVVCVDQSGSMATSVVYASVFSAVLASLPALHTRLVVFDTVVVDLSEELKDPVDVLFATQLGGGTDIDHAIGYCQQLIERPQQTTLVLITDLCEGGNAQSLLKRVAALLAAGVNIVTLLALSDDGAPYFDHKLAGQFTALGIPCFACTPDQFPALMGTALARRDIQQWAAAQGIVLQREKT